MSLGTVLERVSVLCVCRGMGTGTESCWGSSTEPGAGDSPGPSTGLVPCRAPQLHPSGPSCLGEWGEEGNLPGEPSSHTFIGTSSSSSQVLTFSFLLPIP